MKFYQLFALVYAGLALNIAIWTYIHIESEYTSLGWCFSCEHPQEHAFYLLIPYGIALAIAVTMLVICWRKFRQLKKLDRSAVR